MTTEFVSEQEKSEREYREYTARVRAEEDKFKRAKLDAAAETGHPYGPEFSIALARRLGRGVSESESERLQHVRRVCGELLALNLPFSTYAVCAASCSR